MEIPESALRSLRRLQDLGERTSGDDESTLHLYDAKLVRMALNLDQVARYNPPPFPAKESSARYTAYVAKHGITDAWELDALEPRVLRDLIREGAARYFDQAIYDRAQAELGALRNDLMARMLVPGFVERALGVADKSEEDPNEKE